MSDCAVTVRVWAGAGMRSDERCRLCRQAVTWVKTEHGKSLSLTRGFTVETQHQDPVTRARFDVVSKTAIHRCPARETAPRPRLF